jgi:growth arrest-specific protein 8
MPPKKAPAGKKKTTEEEAKARADAVDDIYDDEFKKTLRIEARNLEKLIKKEEDLIGLYNDERLRINYFWLVGKKELEDKQAELRNKEREFQDLEEKHKIEIKIYK